MRLDELKTGGVFVVKNDPKGTRYRVVAQYHGSTVVTDEEPRIRTKNFVDRWGDPKSFEYDAARRLTFAPSTSVVPIEGEI